MLLLADVRLVCCVILFRRWEFEVVVAELRWALEFVRCSFVVAPLSNVFVCSSITGLSARFISSSSDSTFILRRRFRLALRVELCGSGFLTKLRKKFALNEFGSAARDMSAELCPLDSRVRAIWLRISGIAVHGWTGGSELKMLVGGAAKVGRLLVTLA